jgi:hypothetical protein
MSCVFIAELDEPEKLIWKLVNDGSEHMSRLKLYLPLWLHLRYGSNVRTGGKNEFVVDDIFGLRDQTA